MPCLGGLELSPRTLLGLQESLPNCRQELKISWKHESAQREFIQLQVCFPSPFFYLCFLILCSNGPSFVLPQCQADETQGFPVISSWACFSGGLYPILSSLSASMKASGAVGVLGGDNTEHDCWGAGRPWAPCPAFSEYL